MVVHGGVGSGGGVQPPAAAAVVVWPARSCGSGGGGQPVAAPPSVFFFLLFVCRASQIRLTVKMLDASWTPSPPVAPSVVSVCRASVVAHDKNCFPCVSE
jgi:hypothetical protein